MEEFSFACLKIVLGCLSAIVVCGSGFVIGLMYICFKNHLKE